MTTNFNKKDNKNNEEIKPTPPEILSKIKWLQIHGKKNWKLCFVALVFILIIFVLGQLNWKELFSSKAKSADLPKQGIASPSDSKQKATTDINEDTPQHSITFVDKDNAQGAPAPNEVRSIQTPRGKEIPKGTLLEARLGKKPNTVHVKLQLPGQKIYSDIGDLPIRNGVITLPLNLVFLCYAEEDKKAVVSVSNRLTNDGFLTWRDDNNLLPGDDWKTKIEQAMESSDYVLVFLSKKSVNKTGYFQYMMKYALKQRELRPAEKRYIIPIMIDEIDVPRAFKDIYWAHYWETTFYSKLMAALNK